MIMNSSMYIKAFICEKLSTNMLLRHFKPINDVTMVGQFRGGQTDRMLLIEILFLL